MLQQMNWRLHGSVTEWTTRLGAYLVAPYFQFATRAGIRQMGKLDRIGLACREAASAEVVAAETRYSLSDPVFALCSTGSPCALNSLFFTAYLFWLQDSHAQACCQP